jgi:hypothetical protein
MSVTNKSIMLSVVMLSVSRLSVIVLNVAAPCQTSHQQKKHFSLTNDIFWGIMKRKSKTEIAAETFFCEKNDFSILIALKKP